MVFWGLKTMPAGSLWAKAAMRAMMRLLWRQLGPTTPIATLGCVTAYFSSSAEMVWVLPLCRHHRAAVNWLVFENVDELFLVGVGFEAHDLLKKHC